MKDVQDTGEAFGLKREHPELENMKFLHILIFLG